MTVETLVVPCALFDVEEPWTAPLSCPPFQLRRATDAAVPRLPTTVRAWFDAKRLTVLFNATDDFVHAHHREHDAPLYEQDVVEVFLAPESLTRYFELEVSPIGTVFDAAVDSPDRSRATMRVDRSWTCEGLFAAVRKVTKPGGEISIDTVMRIPFAALGRATPADGETWRANFFRIDRHPAHGDEFSAWQPARRVPADFHVPDAFGALTFRGAAHP